VICKFFVKQDYLFSFWSIKSITKKSDMKTIKVLLALTIAGSCLASCRRAPSMENETGAQSEVAANATSEPSVTSDGINNDERKMAKKADVRSRVKDVLAATTQLERVTKEVGGIVMNSKLENREEGIYTQAFTNDSLKEIQTYVPTSTLTLKVPVQYLDTFMNVLVAQSEFINSRNLSLEDLTLQYVGNKLKQDASKANNLAPKNVDNVDYIDAKTEQNINRKLENLSINDQVRYATLIVDLYQPKKVTITLIPNIDNMVKPHFGDQLKGAMQNGWWLIKQLLIGLANLWVFILIGGVVLLIVRRYKTVKPVVKP